MLINLCGPPGSGKTHYCRLLVDEFPHLRYLAIDDYRKAHRKEDYAWYHLIRDAQQPGDVIVESSGLSWHIKAHILPDPEIHEGRTVTVVFCGNPGDFLERCHLRGKPDIPFKYKISVRSLVYAASRKLPKVYPDAIFVRTDKQGNADKVMGQLRETVTSL